MVVHGGQDHFLGLEGAERVLLQHIGGAQHARLGFLPHILPGGPGGEAEAEGRHQQGGQPEGTEARPAGRLRAGCHGRGHGPARIGSGSDNGRGCPSRRCRTQPAGRPEARAAVHAARMFHCRTAMPIFLG